MIRANVKGAISVERTFFKARAKTLWCPDGTLSSSEMHLRWSSRAAGRCSAAIRSTWSSSRPSRPLWISDSPSTLPIWVSFSWVLAQCEHCQCPKPVSEIFRNAHVEAVESLRMKGEPGSVAATSVNHRKYPVSVSRMVKTVCRISCVSKKARPKTLMFTFRTTRTWAEASFKYPSGFRRFQGKMKVKM